MMANIDLFYPVGYLLLAIAFLHPSLSKFKENQLFLRIDANKYIINILGIAFLLIPVTFLIQYFQGSPVNDLLLIISVSVVFILVFLQVRNLSRTYYQVKDKNQELNNQNEMLKTLANIDHVTKLFNRKFLFEYGDQAIKNALFVKKRLAFTIISLDNFNFVEELKTRLEVDQVLLDISNNFLKIKRKDDIVIRFSDSEFIIIFDDIREDLDFEGLMTRFRDNTKFPITIDGEEFQISFSAGITFVPDDGTDVNLLVEKADKALSEAIYSGKEQIRIFSKL
jgi:diguanylate cyclase (GGDEF)-like protein